MATPTWIQTLLQQRAIPFQELHHADAYTAMEVAEREHFSADRVAKVVIVAVDGRRVELILPASRHVNLDRVRVVLGSGEARLATEDEIEAYFADCEVGAIPPLRHWPSVHILMDRSLNIDGDIVFQAGTHRDAIRVSFRDWYPLVNPQVASFSEPVELVPA